MDIITLVVDAKATAILALSTLHLMDVVADVEDSVVDAADSAEVVAGLQSSLLFSYY